jgi:hypothetical protein
MQPRLGDGRGFAEQLFGGSSNERDPTMRLQCFLLIAVIVLAVTVRVDAQDETRTGQVSGDEIKAYAFTPSDSGQVTATLSWDNPSANLMLMLVCGNSEAVPFGAAAGQLDRTARLEAGILGLVQCMIGVSTFDEPATYRLNLQRSTDQTSRPTTATLHGVQPMSSSLVDARLLEQAERTIAQIKAQKR